MAMFGKLNYMNKIKSPLRPPLKRGETRARLFYMEIFCVHYHDLLSKEEENHA